LVKTLEQVWKTPNNQRTYEDWAKLAIESNLDNQRYRFCGNLKFYSTGKGRNRKTYVKCEFQTKYGCIACTHFELEAAVGLLEKINVKREELM